MRCRLSIDYVKQDNSLIYYIVVEQYGIARQAGLSAEFVIMEIMRSRAVMAASIGTMVLIGGAFDKTASHVNTGGGRGHTGEANGHSF